MSKSTEPLIAAAPPCADECIAVLKELHAKSCALSGVPVPDTHYTHVAPLIPPAYEDIRMRCPHGVLWHMAPTSEQIAEWVRDGVE